MWVCSTSPRWCLSMCCLLRMARWVSLAVVWKLCCAHGVVVCPLTLPNLSSSPPTHTPSPSPDRKVFLATWKEIPSTNEVQSSFATPSLTTDQVQSKLEANNIFLVAKRTVEVGGARQVTCMWGAYCYSVPGVTCASA